MKDRPIQCRPPEDSARQLQAQEVRASIAEQGGKEADPKFRREIPKTPWYRGNIVLAIIPLAIVLDIAILFGYLH